jgi:hypothetical protein
MVSRRSLSINWNGLLDIEIVACLSGIYILVIFFNATEWLNIAFSDSRKINAIASR